MHLWLLLSLRRERGAVAGGSGRFSDVVIGEVPLVRALSPFLPGFKLIDESLQVSGFGAGPVGVTGTLRRAPPGLLARRVGAQLAPGRRSETDSPCRSWRDPFESDCLPSRSPAQQLGWRRPAGLCIPAPPGWLVHNLCSSFTLLHPQPAKKSTPEKSPRLRRARGAISRRRCGRTALGTCWKARRAKLFFEVCEATPLLRPAPGQLPPKQFQDADSAGSAAPDPHPSLRTSGYRST